MHLKEAAWTAEVVLVSHNSSSFYDMIRLSSCTNSQSESSCLGVQWHHPAPNGINISSTSIHAWICWCRSAVNVKWCCAVLDTNLFASDHDYPWLQFDQTTWGCSGNHSQQTSSFSWKLIQHSDLVLPYDVWRCLVMFGDGVHVVLWLWTSLEVNWALNLLLGSCAQQPNQRRFTPAKSSVPSIVMNWWTYHFWRTGHKAARQTWYSKWSVKTPLQWEDVEASEAYRELFLEVFWSLNHTHTISSMSYTGPYNELVTFDRYIKLSSL